MSSGAPFNSRVLQERVNRLVAQLSAFSEKDQKEFSPSATVLQHIMDLAYDFHGYDGSFSNTLDSLVITPDAPAVPYRFPASFLDMNTVSAGTAGADGQATSPLAKPPPPPPHQLHPSQVIVIGMGLAGLCATIEALNHGAHVTVLEKNKNLGGNSAKATSGMNACNTPAQAAIKVKDSPELFTKDTTDSGGPTADSDLIYVMSRESSKAVEFLSQYGVHLTALSQLGGHSVPRTHREAPAPSGAPAPAVGWDIVNSLQKNLTQVTPDRLTVITGAKAERLLVRPNNGGSDTARKQNAYSASNAGAQFDSRRVGGPVGPLPVDEKLLDEEVHAAPGGVEVVGIEYTDSSGERRKIYGDAVILTTGGYAADRGKDSILNEFAPSMMKLATTNGEFAQGEGIKIARRIGAALTDMDKVQVHPTGFVDPSNPMALTKILAPEALRGLGGLLLDATGNRFVNELGLRELVSAMIFENGFIYTNTRDLKCAYLMLNDKAVDIFGRGAFEFYANKKHLFRTFSNATEMADELHMDSTALLATIKTYQQAASEGNDRFGKTVFPMVPTENERLHVAVVTPSLHYTMGGLKIDGRAQVLSTRGVHFDSSTVIPGLFAAGEVTGGVHGKNRLAGNSLLECVVFGRAAGKRAADTNQAHLQALRPDVFTPLPFRDQQLVGKNTKIFRFDLPSSKQALGYGAAQYIAVRAILGGKPQVRYYSPISRYDDMGHVDLLLKVDPGAAAAASMPHHIDALLPGDTLEFAGPFGSLRLNLELSYPGQWMGNMKQLGGVKKIGLIAGGVGISPMIQILRSVFFHDRHDVELKMLYAAEHEEDLVLRDKIRNMEKAHPEFQATFVLNHPPESSHENYVKGFITPDLIKQKMFPPSNDVKIVICGPWKMCQIMKETLDKLGYSKQMYHSFM